MNDMADTFILVVLIGIIFLALTACGPDKDAQVCTGVIQVQSFSACHYDSYFNCNLCETAYSDGSSLPRCNPEIGDIKE